MKRVRFLSTHRLRNTKCFVLFPRSFESAIKYSALDNWTSRKISPKFSVAGERTPDRYRLAKANDDRATLVPCLGAARLRLGRGFQQDVMEADVWESRHVRGQSSSATRVRFYRHFKLWKYHTPPVFSSKYVSLNSSADKKNSTAELDKRGRRAGKTLTIDGGKKRSPCKSPPSIWGPRSRWSPGRPSRQAPSFWAAGSSKPRFPSEGRGTPASLTPDPSSAANSTADLEQYDQTPLAVVTNVQNAILKYWRSSVNYHLRLSRSQLCIFNCWRGSRLKLGPRHCLRHLAVEFVN